MMQILYIAFLLTLIVALVVWLLFIWNNWPRLPGQSKDPAIRMLPGQLVILGVSVLLYLVYSGYKKILAGL